MSATKIYAVTVNHNTSHFVELMLRTLFYKDDLSGIDFHMFVLDNNSGDEYLGQLQAYLDRVDLPVRGFRFLGVNSRHPPSIQNAWGSLGPGFPRCIMAACQFDCAVIGGYHAA